MVLKGLEIPFSFRVNILIIRTPGEFGGILSKDYQIIIFLHN